MNLFFIILFIYLINGYHLSNNQYNSIMNLIKNHDLTKIQRNKLNVILYKSYEKYAIKRSLIFKKKHFQKCKKISNSEITWYGKMGLYKSIIKYDGRSNFTYFSAVNINFELLKSLNDAHSLSVLPVYIRIKNKKNFTKNEMNNYKKLLNVNLHGDTSFWQDKYNDNSYDSQYNLYKCKKLWCYIETLDPTIKEYVYLKYDHNFNIIRKQKDIAEIKSVSTETIRKKSNEFKRQMKEYFLIKEK